MRFVLVDTLREYEDITTHPCDVPILRGNPHIRSVAQALGHDIVDRREWTFADGAGSGRDELATEGAVITWDAKYVPLAALYSGRTGRRLVTVHTFADAINTLASEVTAVLIGPAVDINYQNVCQLQRAAYERFHTTGWTGGVGIFTGRDLAHTSAFIAKQFMSYRASGTAVIVPGANTFPDMADAELFTRANISAERLRALFTSVLQQAYILGHGTDDFIYLGEDVLCGRVRNDAPYAPGELPRCVYDGRCLKDGDIMTADEFRAQLLVADTCMGFKTYNAAFSNDFSIGLALLDGWVQTYIATNKLKSGGPDELFLFSILARLGFPIGAIVTLVNAYLASAGIDEFTYLLMGDPTRRVEQGQRPVGNNSIARETDVLRLSPSGLAADWVTGRHTVPLEGPNMERWYQIPWDHGALLVAQGASDADAKLQNRTTDTAAFFGSLSLAIRFGEETRTFGGGMTGRINDLRNRIRHASHLFRASETERASSHDMKHVQEKIRALLDPIQADTVGQIAGKIERNPFLYTDYYLDMFEIAATANDATCYVCGEIAQIRTLTHVFNRDLSRRVTLCPRCGNILDAPDSGITAWLEGPDHFSQGLNQALVVSNQSKFSRRVTAAIRISRTRAQVEPGMEVVDLDPESSCRLLFRLAPSSTLYPHQHFVKAIVVANLDVLYLQKPVYVRP